MYVGTHQPPITLRVVVMLRRPSCRTRFFSALKLMARYRSGVMPGASTTILQARDHIFVSYMAMGVQAPIVHVAAYSIITAALS